jgi:NAD(P)-dependent dehydrogenase (short-subunit alcohol dehydrogenase family)
VTPLRNVPLLTGKVALVIGGGRGVGRAVSRALAGAGAHVHVVARTEDQLADTVRLIEGAGGVAVATAVDVTRPEGVFDVLKPRVERLSGSPHILVNSAGVFGPIALVAESDPDAWIRTIALNTIAPYLTCRAFVGGMVASGWGRIVNVTSAASLHPPGPLNSAYATSKVALNHFTRCLAAELTGTGVTANVIHPGEVKTDMWRYIRDEAERLGPEGEPLRTWANDIGKNGGDPPEKAADLVLSLMSDVAASTTGQFLWIRDGLQRPVPTHWNGDEDQT